jgi:hypothetical protein
MRQTLGVDRTYCLDSLLVSSQAEVVRELRRAAGLYRQYPDDSWGLLRGSYIDAVRAGLMPERIESISGFSIAQLEEIVGPA